MDCRKARYFLVASFDAPLSEADQKELTYHLKDCRDCRHESFYYRELFSAEKQVPVRLPASDFNERLLSEIRLREARSAWPKAAPARKPLRWSLVYVPAVLGAAAAFTFFAYVPHPATDVALQEPLATTSQSLQLPAVTQVSEPVRPRYVPVYQPATNRRMGMIFELPATGWGGASGDPFGHVIILQPSPVQHVGARTHETYVYPVVTEAERDRIY